MLLIVPGTGKTQSSRKLNLIIMSIIFHKLFNHENKVGHNLGYWPSKMDSVHCPAIFDKIANIFNGYIKQTLNKKYSFRISKLKFRIKVGVKEQETGFAHVKTWGKGPTLSRPECILLYAIASLELTIG